MEADIASSDVRATISESISSLEQIAAGTHPEGDELRVVATHLAGALVVTLAALSASLGECRNAVPYSPMHPVLDSNGFRWCCNHDPQHCGPRA